MLNPQDSLSVSNRKRDVKTNTIQDEKHSVMEAERVVCLNPNLSERHYEGRDVKAILKEGLNIFAGRMPERVRPLRRLVRSTPAQVLLRKQEPKVKTFGISRYTRNGKQPPARRNGGTILLIQ
jgi:hypothetical protein